VGVEGSGIEGKDTWKEVFFPLRNFNSLLRLSGLDVPVYLGVHYLKGCTNDPRMSSWRTRYSYRTTISVRALLSPGLRYMPHYFLHLLRLRRLTAKKDIFFS